MNAAGRHGFTLTEVAFALMIVTVGVTASMMVFPIALKSQQETRYRILAAAQVQALVRKLTTSPEVFQGTEAQLVNDRPGTNAAVWSPDLENRHSTSAIGGGLLPVPRQIALRIDSVGDEIADLLGRGENLYFAAPGRPGWENLSIEQIGTEQFKIVLGILGPPQQNMLNFHPQVKWPYLDFMPSSYLSQMKMYTALIDSSTARLPELASATGFATNAKSNTIASLDLALKTLDPPTDIDLLARSGYAPDRIRGSLQDLEQEYGTDPLGLQALRFNMRTALLCWYANAAGEAASALPAPQDGQQQWPSSDLAIARFQVAYEMLLIRVRFLQTHKPYDLRMPRDRSTMLCTDVPLLQYDLTAPPVQTTPMHAWKILSDQPITALGSMQWYGTTPPATIESGARTSSSGWNLTVPFSPSERIREVVVWAVDWTSYEDFEEAPSAPVAAALLPFMPRQNRGQAPTSSSPGTVTVDFSYQNGSPEYPYTWADILRNDMVNDRDFQWHFNYLAGNNGNVPNRAKAWLGTFGADRNGNGRFDRGTVKPSVRLRAINVGRYLVYDPRGWVQER